MQSDKLAAALVALAYAGVPPDVQELLLKNNALEKAIEAASAQPACDHVWAALSDPANPTADCTAYCSKCGCDPSGKVVMTPRLNFGPLRMFQAPALMRITLTDEDLADLERLVGNTPHDMPLIPGVQAQHVAAPTLKLGIIGKAYDKPEDRRAYTYDHQPHNVEAYKLGRACSEIHSGGDWIDRGLNLLNALQREGFGVFELATAPAKQEGAL